MSRRSHSILVAVAAVATLVLGACGGATATPIADAKEILVKSVEAAQAAKTVHLKAEVTGSLPLGDLSGLLGGLSGIPGASGLPVPSAAASPAASGAGLKLDGTTVEGDIDLAGSAAHLAFTVPSLLNLEGDLIAVDDAVYVKVSLLGDKYQKMSPSSPTGASPAPSVSPSPTTGMLDSLRAELDKLATPPEKLADEHCGDTDCYHVRVKLDSTDTAPLASLAPGMTATGTLDVYVRKNDLRPAQLVLTGASGTASGLTVTVDFSDWDKAVDIKAPPADQVDTSGGLFPSFAIPSFPSPSP